MLAAHFMPVLVATAVPVIFAAATTATGVSTAQYSENHAFAVFFTLIAAASQGFGGLIVVLGMSDYGTSVAHLMSFSTGVMVYLSFMDIMVETTAGIGELAASVSFFCGMCLFMLLEVALPEVEGEQLVALLGIAWTPSSGKDSAAPTTEPSSPKAVAAPTSLDADLDDTADAKPKVAPPPTPTETMVDSDIEEDEVFDLFG